jgi:hypothetical protein
LRKPTAGALEILAPNTSAKWAAISLVVRPFALSDNAISSTPVFALAEVFLHFRLLKDRG